MFKAASLAIVLLVCLLQVEAAPANRISEIRSMCSYYTGNLLVYVYIVGLYSGRITLSSVDTLGTAENVMISEMYSFYR